MKPFVNPIIPLETNGRTGDPYVWREGDVYYQCYHTEHGVTVAKAKELADLNEAKAVEVFHCLEGTDFSHWFAPELHRIDGVWYIYGAPFYRDTHIMAVLSNENEDPQTPFALLGPVEGLQNNWNLDGTVTEYGGKRWFIWSSGAALHIGELTEPNRVSGPIVTLKEPEFEFELRENRICEGPACLWHEGKLHLIYSVNESNGDEYCLGRITFNGTGDILDLRNWETCETAVFEKTESVFGPGHCSFTTVQNNGVWEDYILYHANLESGSGWHGRSVWAQKVAWDENGYPVFGTPHR